MNKPTRAELRRRACRFAMAGIGAATAIGGLIGIATMLSAMPARPDDRAGYRCCRGGDCRFAPHIAIAERREGRAAEAASGAGSYGEECIRQGPGNFFHGRWSGGAEAGGTFFLRAAGREA